MHVLPPSVKFFQRGWLSSNNVLLHDSNKAILIDTGYCTHANQTLALVRGVLGQQELDVIANTHLHSDHCGGNALFQSTYPNVETYIPPGQARYVDSWNSELLSFKATGQQCPPFVRTSLMKDGDFLEVAGLRWRICSAPGHDPHSIVVFNEKYRILISADALWENGFGVVFPELDGVSAFDEVASTLQLIEDLSPRLVLPGHGNSFTDTSDALVRAKSRLTQFKNDPEKHASYAAKVLLKFKLLEVQTCAYHDLLMWAADTDYLKRLHSKYSNDMPFDTWITEICESLAKNGACLMIENNISNMD